MNSTDLKAAVVAVVAAIYSGTAGIAQVLTGDAVYTIAVILFTLTALGAAMLIGRRP